MRPIDTSTGAEYPEVIARSFSKNYTIWNIGLRLRKDQSTPKTEIFEWLVYLGRSEFLISAIESLGDAQRRQVTGQTIFQRVSDLAVDAMIARLTDSTVKTEETEKTKLSWVRFKEKRGLLEGLETIDHAIKKVHLPAEPLQWKSLLAHANFYSWSVS